MKITTYLVRMGRLLCLAFLYMDGIFQIKYPWNGPLLWQLSRLLQNFLKTLLCPSPLQLTRIQCYTFLAMFLLNSPVFLSLTCWHSIEVTSVVLQQGNNDKACKDGSGLYTPIQTSGQLNFLRTQLVILPRDLYQKTWHNAFQKWKPKSKISSS